MPTIDFLSHQRFSAGMNYVYRIILWTAYLACRHNPLGIEFLQILWTVSVCPPIRPPHSFQQHSKCSISNNTYTQNSKNEWSFIFQLFAIEFKKANGIKFLLLKLEVIVCYSSQISFCLSWKCITSKNTNCKLQGFYFFCCNFKWREKVPKNRVKTRNIL